jgi:hypothetical protein
MTAEKATRTAAATQVVLCGNEDHAGPVEGYARVTWPDGRFKPTTACHRCLRNLVNAYVFGGMPGEQHSVHIDLIGPS